MTKIGLLKLAQANVIVACFGLISAIGDISPGYAEDSRGRLPDGRAYRKDTQGNTMVDHIAELEVEADSLRRQLQSLEEERAERMARGEKIAPDCQVPIQEKTLISSCPACPPVRSPEKICPQVQEKSCPPVPEKICPQVVAAPPVEKVCPQVEQKICPVVPDRTTELQLAVDSQREADEKLFAANAELVKTQAEAARLNAEIQRLNLTVASLKHDLQLVQVHQEQVSRPERDDTDFPAVAEEKSKEEISKASYRPSPREEQRGPDPLANMRNVVLTEINQVSTAIVQRNNLYENYSQKNSAVKFSPARPVSNRGLSLQDLKSKVGEASSSREISLVKREVSEIKSKIDFDIGMMTRLKAMQ